VLGVLADAADRNGRCDLSQTVIAQRAGVSEITARRVLSSLQEAGFIRREHRSAGGKTGRIADLIFLNMEGNAVVQPVKIIGNDVGATDQNDRLQSVVQPIKMIVAPRTVVKSENSIKSTPRARADVYTTSPDKIQPRISGRVWLEKRNGTWRARVRLDGVELDLGRFPTEAEAASALGGALADIEHASAHRSGEPRQPRPNPDVLDVAGLGAAWPDTFSDEWRKRYELREPIAMGKRKISDAPSIEPDDGVFAPNNAYLTAKEGE
jgi:DNA-binding MarR family transcriptional regulator